MCSSARSTPTPTAAPTTTTEAISPQRGMFDVQNIYGTPQVPRKKPCLRPRRMTLIDLRNVPLTEDETPQRKASSGTVRSEGGLSHYSKSGIWQIHDSTDSLPTAYKGSMRTKHSSDGSQDGSSRFPKLEECAHFHYDFVDFGPLQVTLCDDDRENYRHNEVEKGEVTLLVRVSCNNKAWTVRRTLSNFASLDRQLHRCIFDRKFSHLPELHANMDLKNRQEMEQMLQNYLKKFTELAGPMINCGSILNWLEMDNRGNRLLAVDDSGINTPAIAAAHAIKRYNAQAADEISLQVGDIVSVIDMPPAEDTIWWRGKRGFEVGFFPSQCVEVIGDKVPPSMATVMPTTGSLSSSPGNTLTPLSTPATARKPCELEKESSEDTASMIRKHGKLMSFLRTFFSTRPPRNQLKQSGIVKERVFGCDLGEHLLNSGHDVPVVLKSCTEVIERYGIVDGIYRLSGITSNIQKLRVAFDEDQVPELMESTYLQDIHSISSLLKMYFRELPNPLLTYQLYDKFAEAVRDEDNKLLRIHDVVQQLPPPHYRTLEYLMRHLDRVASHAFETGMHSKNLAIVWAPNLLRSKELELGGGAAALQGVGIQAVVTECLICYCDLIFNDKMPSHNSPHLQKSQKKPRPKSLAISTPTRLLSLEEARERAFLGSLAHSQRFIDVGGGPANLPPNYHTVIDLPGYKKKSNKDTNKGKKSPVSGWKSIFSKPRAGSVKKARKGSVQEEDQPLGSMQAKALTEEDVHNWKRRLRSAKSAESLLSMATSARSSISSQTSSSLAFTDSVSRHREERVSPHHKRSLSSDASTVLRHHHHHHHHDSPRLESLQSPPQHPPPSMPQSENAPSPGSHRSRTDRRADPPRKQSFVRGDSTRKALHRRTPSAPNTPRLDRDRHNATPNSVSNHNQKSSSQPHLDSLSPSSTSSSSLLTSPTDTSLGIDIDAAIKARLQQMAMQSRNARSNHSSPRSPEKFPGEGDRRGETEKRKVGEEVLELQSSPGSHRRQDPASPIEPSRFFVSRYHDYAEILSDDEGSREVSAPSSTTDMQELMDKLDSKLSSAAKCYMRDNEDTSEPEPKHAKLESSADKATEVSKRTIERVRASSGGSNSVPSTQVVRRRAELISSERALTAEQAGIGVEFPELTPRPMGNAALPPIPHHRQRQAVHQGSASLQQANMSKCLSVPSDIAQSLENITSSQNDLLSSVTLSELSQSINSFCTTAQDETPARDHPRWRRSTSLDSIEAERESSLCRTLRDINAQMDVEFHQKVERAIQLEEEGYSRHGNSDTSSLPPLHISEDNLVTPTALHETHFPTTPETVDDVPIVLTDTGIQNTRPRSSSDNSGMNREGASVIAPQPHPPPDSDYDPDYAVIADREPALQPGDIPPPPLPPPPQPVADSQTDFPDYAVVDKSRRKKDKKLDVGESVAGDSVPSGVLSMSAGAAPDVVQPTDPGSGDTASSVRTQWVEEFTGNMTVVADIPLYDLPPSGREVCDMQVTRTGELSPVSRTGAPSPVPRTDALSPVPRTGALSPVPRTDALSPVPRTGELSPVPRTDALSPVPRTGELSPMCAPSNAQSDPGVPNAHFQSTTWSQSAVSTGVCLVKRQRNSSSSSSSSDSSQEDNSDDSMEVVYNAQTLDTSKSPHHQGKPGETETLHPPNSHPSNLHPPSTTGLNVSPTSPEIPGDLRQFSPDDVLWRQSPLLGKSGECSDGDGAGVFSYHSPNDREVTDAQRAGAAEEISRTLAGPSEHPGPVSPQGRTLAGPSERPDPVSAEGRTYPQEPVKQPVSSAQPDVVLKFQREDLPIISGCADPYPSSPSAQRSLLPSPNSPTLSSPSSFQSSRIPCPRSPTLSCPPPSHPSGIPSPRSPPLPASSPSCQSRIPRSPASPPVSHPSPPGVDTRAESPGVPLHLMLYHPEEFQVPPVNVGGGTETPLPQVHVKSDMVTEEKAVIRKVSSGRAAPDKPQQAEVPEWTPGADVHQDNWQSGPSSDGLTGPTGGMQLGKVEQDSMEVDNLCNRLVDELHAVGTHPSPILQDQDVFMPSPARGAVQVEAVVERRVEETEIGGEAIVEQRLVRVESFGEVQDEEMENALNVGKEMLLAHASTSSPTSIHISTITTAAATTTTITSSSPSSGSGQAKSCQERRPSASKIPRFHKRTDSHEEKTAVSDLSQGDITMTASVSVSSSSSTSDTIKAPVSPRSSNVNEQSKNLSPRTSKIPLSQKIPSPTSSFREPKGSKSATASSSPKSAAPSPVKTQNSAAKAPPGPVPRARTSIHKSDHVAPPAEEVVEIARPSVKKRTSLNQKGDRNAAAAAAGKESKGGKSVIVQELKMEKGDAKLVIEKQPNLKKKIQTVHARKVSHPPRQIAEALDTDSCDSPPADFSSTGPSDMEHSGMSSQEDEVFSDESLRFRVGRDRSYSSGAGRGVGSPQFPRQPPSPSTHLGQCVESYQHMAASRSSLDDSALQLAAERHDDLIPNWDSSLGGYSTGSLRAHRSQKMRNLMEVFERGTGSHSSEDSAEVRVKDRSGSTSGSTTISVGSQDKEPDTDDDIFQPPGPPRLPLSLASRRSRSRDRAARGASMTSPHRRPSQSPTATRPSTGRGDEAVLRRRRPSPLGREPARAPGKVEGGYGRPPRYRSASRGRTYSDSSTSESDNTQYLESGRSSMDSPSRPRGLPRGRPESASSRASRQADAFSSGTGSAEERFAEDFPDVPEEGIQRQGSIKELRQLFEKGPKEDSKDSGSELSPPVPVRRSIRTRSVSPGADNPLPVVPNIMRHSLEIPSSSSILKQRETPLTSQPLRLGPKPFYGSRK